MNKQYIVKSFGGGTFYHKNKEMTILHREDGPAVEWDNGCKEWWLNNKLHREDGPAYEGLHGNKEWFLNGRIYSEEEHKRLTSK